MALPRLQKPLVKIVMPSTKKETAFQPMDRRCEKLLLIAKESKDPVEWVDAVRQCVTNCAVDDIDVDALASFDLEYAFVKLRAVSMSPNETLAYRDAADNRIYEVEVDLNRVEVVFPAGETSEVIEVAENVKMSLRWPTGAAWADPAVTRADNPEDALDALVAHCVDKVWVGEEVYEASTSGKQEVIEFVQSLDVATWGRVREWATKVPHLSYWVEWTNSSGDKRRVELRTLTDFFSFSRTDGT